MGLIKNFESLAKTPERRVVLEIIEAGLTSLQPDHFLRRSVWVDGGRLTIHDQTVNLDDFQRIHLLGFGKGSAAIAKSLEQILGYKLTDGYVIDVTGSAFEKIRFYQGTHPLPSKQNIESTSEIIKQLGPLTEKDLVLTVICGGGSAMLELPSTLSYEAIAKLGGELLRSGATIFEMNTIRKHVSQVKGGGLARLLYPATILATIVSDVPGNDLSQIASGPTVKDATTKESAWELAKKYGLDGKIGLTEKDFHDTPSDSKYFERVKNIPLLTNHTAIEAMKEKAGELGFQTFLYSDSFQGEAREVGQELIRGSQPRSILLAGGETHVKVVGRGSGGRNLELAAGALEHLDTAVTLASFDSDGWDNSPFAGAMVDYLSVEKASELGLSPSQVLTDNDTFSFFQKLGDGLDTGRLPSNVSDLMIVLRK